MKKENTSTRLKQIMEEKQLRQVDILEKCKPFCQKYNVKLGRNDLSQYVNGKVEPGQEKLTILGLALNVSEAWLMGFDVPEQRNYPISEKNNSNTAIMSYYNQLNTLGKETATEQVRLLTLDEKYIDQSIHRFPSDYGEERDYLKPKAAHNDHLDEEGEKEKMALDIANLQRP